MKEILDEESKNALINYRIQRAYEDIERSSSVSVSLSIMLPLIASIMHAITQRFPCYKI